MEISNQEITVITPTGRFMTIGYVSSDEFIVTKDSMMLISRFLRDYYECKDKFDVLNQLIDDAINNLAKNHGFEVGLLVDYLMYKMYSRYQAYGHHGSKSCIEKFVSIIGIMNFSEFFQKLWNGFQPVEYYFGTVSIVIGKDPYSPLDILLDLLAEIDDKRSELKEGKILPEWRMDNLRSVLLEGSVYSLKLKDLIILSESIDDKLTSSGCKFLYDLINRIGLNNLPDSVRTEYLRVFLPN